ncbi:unnamed protein product [Paramecium octaurelia]|uniref:Uncharacterized protein n=1 Tax=Paramecium octaurelia TaxID=43137 RepID=A0A8S1UK78_PAROT|nr:unnamed protein product [Paramecium octaurelia]
MIENEKDFSCWQGHQLPVVTIALDPQLSRNQRLLCTEWLENTDLDAKVVELKKIISLIEEAQLKKMEKVEYVIVNQIKLIEQLNNYNNNGMDQKSIILKIIIISVQLYEQLEITIMKQNKIDDNSQQLIHEIQQTNHCWTSKLYPRLELFNTFLEYQKCKELFSNLEFILRYLLQINNNNKQQQINLIMINKNYYRNLKSDQTQLINLLNRMISNQYKDIKVWSFLNGTIKLVKTLQGHSNVQCLVVSKKQNSFISCSSDGTIRCWQKITKLSGFLLNLINSIQLMIYYFLEVMTNQLQFGRLILIKINLAFLYSLDEHSDMVVSLSLNQSENQLVSCADGQNQIIIWERREEDKFEFKYFDKQSINDFGLKVKFIKENQFIWITGEKQTDFMYLNQIKESIKKNRIRQFNQLQIMKIMMNSVFQQFIIREGIQQQQDIRNTYISLKKLMMGNLKFKINQIVILKKFMEISQIMDNIWFIGIKKIKHVQHKNYQINEQHFKNSIFRFYQQILQNSHLIIYQIYQFRFLRLKSCLFTSNTQKNRLIGKTSNIQILQISFFPKFNNSLMQFGNSNTNS